MKYVLFILSPTYLHTVASLTIILSVYFNDYYNIIIIIILGRGAVCYSCLAPSRSVSRSRGRLVQLSCCRCGRQGTDAPSSCGRSFVGGSGWVGATGTMAHSPSSEAMPKKWPRGQTKSLEENIQSKLLFDRMKKAKLEIRQLDRQLGQLKEMGIEELEAFVGKRLFDPRATLQGSNKRRSTTKKRRRRLVDVIPGDSADQLPGVRNARQRNPSASASGFMGKIKSEWNRRLEDERQRRVHERKQMRAADKEAQAVREVERRRMFEFDERLFVYYAGKFGPLDGMLYVSTATPGKLYEKLATEACCTVQKWWRDIGPQRMLRKKEAATFMQSLYRGRRGRATYINEAKVKGALRKLFNRVANQVWQTWTYNVRKATGMRRLLRNRIMGSKSQCFEAWSAWVRDIMHAREEALTPALVQFKHRKKAGAFRSWVFVYEHSLKVKNMMQRSFAGHKQYYFELWSEVVMEWVEHKLKTQALRGRAATEIQRIWRGKFERDNKVRVAQYAKHNRRREQQRELARRQVYRRKLISQHEEQARLERERIAVQKVVLEEMSGFDKLIKTNRDWKRRMKGKLLVEEREKWMRDAHHEAVREFREYDPPHRECSQCWMTFSDDHSADSHLCTPQAGGNGQQGGAESVFFRIYHAENLEGDSKTGWVSSLFKRNRKLSMAQHYGPDGQASSPGPSESEGGDLVRQGTAGDTQLDDCGHLSDAQIQYPKTVERLTHTVERQRAEMTEESIKTTKLVALLKEKLAVEHSAKLQVLAQKELFEEKARLLHKRLVELELDNKRLGGNAASFEEDFEKEMAKKEGMEDREEMPADSVGVGGDLVEERSLLRSREKLLPADCGGDFVEERSLLRSREKLLPADSGGDFVEERSLLRSREKLLPADVSANDVGVGGDLVEERSLLRSREMLLPADLSSNDVGQVSP